MNAPTPKITPRALLLKPRDWQQIAQRQAADMLGTPEAAEKLAEARRYGALADELEHLQSCMRQMAALFGVPSASPAELVALVQRAIADRDDALAAESIAQLAAEATHAQEPAGELIGHIDFGSDQPSTPVYAAPQPAAAPAKFRLGDRVRKTRGREWQGRIVGTYSTSLTSEGYVVESEVYRGSAHITLASALVLMEGGAV